MKRKLLIGLVVFLIVINLSFFAIGYYSYLYPSLGDFTIETVVETDKFLTLNVTPSSNATKYEVEVVKDEEIIYQKAEETNQISLENLEANYNDQLEIKVTAYNKNNEEKEKQKEQEKTLDKNKFKKPKKAFTIMGISIWRLLAYFIIYSVAGYIVETIYGIITKGVWESRQSFLYGPFCGIYGLGAVIMIIFLHKYKTKYNALFIGGFIVGSITEYLVSLFGEMILGVKWWDYSGMPLNINGRICVYFSLFWGFLGMYLIASLNPKVDRIIDWVKGKFKTYKSLKTFILITVILLVVDCIATGFAIEFFLVRMIVNNDINVSNKEAVEAQYEKIYGNEKLSKFIYEFWGDKKMIKTFPNLKVKDKDGNIVYMDSFLDIQPY